MNVIVVSKLAEEYSYLDQWFGPGKYRLAGRSLSYAPSGRVYDVLDIISNRKQYQITFDATRIRPPAPAGAAASSASWIVPAIIVAGAVAGLYWINRDRK